MRDTKIFQSQLHDDEILCIVYVTIDREHIVIILSKLYFQVIAQSNNKLHTYSVFTKNYLNNTYIFMTNIFVLL